MTDPAANDVERLLSRALAPVDPPDGLGQRLESRLQSLSDLAAEELEGWELRAMRDPRNWARPAAALAIGAAAGAGLLVLRMRHTHKRTRTSRAAERAGRTLGDVRRKLPRR
jgi:hypothetical protein